MKKENKQVRKVTMSNGNSYEGFEGDFKKVSSGFSPYGAIEFKGKGFIAIIEVAHIAETKYLDIPKKKTTKSKK